MGNTTRNAVLFAAASFTFVTGCGLPAPVATTTGGTSTAGTTGSTGSTVTAAVLALTPNTKSLPVRGLARLTATATRDGAAIEAPAITWTVTEAAGGEVTEAGTYQAPTVPGSYHVVASAYDAASGTNLSASATITVTAQATNSPSISGTISYAGARSGSIRIIAIDSQGRTVAESKVAGPGTYTLTRIGGPGPFTLQARLSPPSLRGRVRNSALGAFGEITNVTLNSTTANITLTTPSAATPDRPILSGLTLDGSTLRGSFSIGGNPRNADSLVERASSYSVRILPTGSSTPLQVLNFAARGEAMYSFEVTNLPVTGQLPACVEVRAIDVDVTTGTRCLSEEQPPASTISSRVEGAGAADVHYVLARDANGSLQVGRVATDGSFTVRASSEGTTLLFVADLDHSASDALATESARKRFVQVAQNDFSYQPFVLPEVWGEPGISISAPDSNGDAPLVENFPAMFVNYYETASHGPPSFVWASCDQGCEQHFHPNFSALSDSGSTTGITTTFDPDLSDSISVSVLALWRDANNKVIHEESFHKTYDNLKWDSFFPTMISCAQGTQVCTWSAPPFALPAADQFFHRISIGKIAASGYNSAFYDHSLPDLATSMTFTDAIFEGDWEVRHQYYYRPDDYAIISAVQHYTFDFGKP